MTTPATIAHTIAAQFDAVGPKRVTFRGKAYAFWTYVVTEDGTVRAKFRARKPSGAIVAPQVSISITYDPGADLYDVEIVHVRADATIEHVRDLVGMFAEDFANFGEGDLAR